MDNIFSAFRSGIRAHFLLCFLWVVAGLAFPAGLMAQDQPAVQADTAAKVIRAVPPSEITRESERSITLLRNVQGVVSGNDKALEIRKALPELTQAIATSKERVDSMDLLSLTLNRLGDIKSRWVRYETQLSDWQKVLIESAKALGTEQSRLTEQKGIWEKTRAENAEKQEDVPLALRERVENVLVDIERVNSSLKDTLAGILTLEDALSDQQRTVTIYIAKLDSANTEIRASLFVRERPRLWDETRADADTLSLVRKVEDTWQDTVEDTTDFFIANSFGAILQLLIFGVLILLFYILRYRGRQFALSDKPHLKGYTLVLDKPISAALLIAIVNAVWLYTNPPVVMISVFLLLLQIPLLLIYQNIVYSSLRRVLYGILGLILLEQLASLLFTDPIYSRWFLLLETLAGLAGSLWLARNGRYLRGPQVWSILVALAPVFALLFLVSLYANLNGTVSLALLLTHSTLVTVFLGLVYYLAVVVMESVVAIAVETRLLRFARVVRNRPHEIKKRLSEVFRWVALFLWARGSLNSFSLLTPLKELLNSFVNASWTSGTVTISVGTVLEFFLVLLVAWLAARLFRVVLEEEVLSRLSLPKGVPAAISFVVNYTILTVGFFLALGATGISLDKFGFLAGALGVGIGFGLQNIVTNFVSGLILVFERPINVGDTVEVGTLKGIVNEIGLRSSKVRTFQGAEVVVPNGELIANKVTNWTLSDSQRRLEIPVGVAYGSNPRKVMELMEQVARQHPDVLQDPAPKAYFLGFGDSALNFRLLFWVNDNLLGAPSDIALGIHDELLNEGISIPFPQRDVNLRWAKETEVGVVSPLPSENQEKRPSLSQKENELDSLEVSDDGGEDDGR